jgi:hypothetical protein
MITIKEVMLSNTNNYDITDCLNIIKDVEIDIIKGGFIEYKIPVFDSVRKENVLDIIKSFITEKDYYHLIDNDDYEYIQFVINSSNLKEVYE